MYLTNGARSNYHAFTATVNKRMSKGLQFQSSYNFAKNLTNGGGYAPGGFASESGGTLSDPSIQISITETWLIPAGIGFRRHSSITFRSAIHTAQS